MKFTVDRKALNQALAIVSRAVSTRSTLPILSSILVDAGAAAVRLVATDLELAVECVVLAEVVEPGQLTVPAKTFVDLVSQLADGAVVLTGDDRNSAVLTTGRNRYQLMGLPPEEFPAAPEVGTDGDGFECPEDALHRLFRYVEPCLSEDGTRPVLTAALLELTAGQLKAVGLDGHRLAVIAADVQATGEGSILLPGRALREVLRLIDRDGAEPVRVRFDKNQVLVQTAGVSLVSRLIEGQFAKYERVIPAFHVARLTVPVADLQQAVKRAAIVARENANKITLHVETDTLILEAQAGDTGQAREEVPAEWEGEPTEVTLNVRYLLDALQTHECERVAIEYSGGPLQPLVMRDVNEGGGFTVIMPINLT